MDLRKEYERYLAAQQDAQKLEKAAVARSSTTSDRARAARARNQADPERLLKKVAEARSIDRIVPADMQRALLALMRREIKSLLPHPLRGLTDNFTDDAAPLMAALDAQGQAYWGPAPEGGTGTWSGRVFAGGMLVRDYTRSSAAPDGSLLPHGLFGNDSSGEYAGSVQGEYIKVDRTSGDCEFIDADAEELFADATQYEYFLIASKTADGYEAIENATCGDIHVFAVGSMEIAGTPAIYKVVMSMGWKKTSAVANWEQMTAAETASTVPTRLWYTFVDGTDAYPWHAWRPTWDYPRTH